SLGTGGGGPQPSSITQAMTGRTLFIERNCSARVGQARPAWNRSGIPPLPAAAWSARFSVPLSKVIYLLPGLNLLSTGGSPLRVTLTVRNPLLGKGHQRLVKVWLIRGSLKGAADSNAENRLNSELTKVPANCSQKRSWGDSVKSSAPCENEMGFAPCIYDLNGYDLFHKG